MRILFDENVPLLLRQFFPDDQIATVQELGWSGIRNGELLDRAETDFDILLLADKNLRYQQNLTGRSLAIVELPTNRWPVLEPMSGRIVAAVHSAKAGSYVVVDLTASPPTA